MSGAAREASDNQRQASRPAASAWVAANAGSGKTRVLTERVARLLLLGANPSRILCLTYTRAAASEMSMRLFETLGVWSTASDDELRASLAAIGEPPPAGDRLAVARRLFAQALETPGGLKIETIHAFCQRVLQRFPVEAGVAPEFTVLDDRAAGELAQLAMRETLRRLTDGGVAALEGAFEKVLEARGEAGFRSLIAGGLAERGAIEAFLACHGSVDTREVAVRGALRLDADESAKRVRALRPADPGWDRAGLKRAALALAQGKKTDVGYSKAIEDYVRNPSEAGATEAYRKVFYDSKGKLRDKFSTKDLAAYNPRIDDILRQEQIRFAHQIDRERAAEIADLSLAALDLMSAILDDYRALKARRRALDYQDLVAATRALLSSASGAWVHFKLDGGVDHLLIDEAQDTSPSQWDIIRRLTEEFFAHEVSQSGRLRTVFAVGDEKQSIYSFQGAEPKMFAAMRDHFEDRAKAAGQHWTWAALEVSFRSVPEILTVVDETFKPEDARRALSANADEVRHKAARENAHGLVEWWPAETRESEDISVHRDWTRAVDARAKESPEARLAIRIAKLIRSWIDEAAPVIPGGRPIEEADVLILVRRRRALFYESIRALNREGLAVAGADRMVLRDEAAFLDLDALGRFCLMPEDDLALAEVLKGPFVGLSDDDLLLLAPSRASSLWQALGAVPAFANAQSWLARRIHEARSLRPFEFFAHALDGPEGRRLDLLERLGADAEDAIEELLAMALAFEREDAATLQGFLAYAAAHGEAVKRDMEEARGRIRVMTVHGAKGLQAPIVFLIDTLSAPEAIRDAWLMSRDAQGEVPLVRVPADSRDATSAAAAEREADRQSEEYLRQLYVAMTRAADRLYVAGVAGARGRPDNCWHSRIERALAALPETKRLTAEGGLVLRLGEAAQGAALCESSRVSLRPLPAWTRAAAPGEAPVLRRTPSGLLAAEEAVLASPAPGGRGEAILRGRATHRLLEELPKLAPDARRRAASEIFMLPTYRAVAGAAEEIVGEVLRILDDAVFAPLFGPNSRAEVGVVGAFSTPGGRVFISGQIDRLIVLPGAVLILDFKTNRDPGAATVRAYLPQMAAYRRLLMDIFPSRAVEAALLFTAVPRLVALKAEELDVIAITQVVGKRTPS
jgi:ATP-dependent helicase/nuclease subunit A